MDDDPQCARAIERKLRQVELPPGEGRSCSALLRAGPRSSARAVVWTGQSGRASGVRARPAPSVPPPSPASALASSRAFFATSSFAPRRVVEASRDLLRRPARRERVKTEHVDRRDPSSTGRSRSRYDRASSRRASRLGAIRTNTTSGSAPFARTRSSCSTADTDARWLRRIAVPAARPRRAAGVAASSLTRRADASASGGPVAHPAAWSSWRDAAQLRLSRVGEEGAVRIRAGQRVRQQLGRCRRRRARSAAIRHCPRRRCEERTEPFTPRTRRQ